MNVLLVEEYQWTVEETEEIVLHGAFASHVSEGSALSIVGQPDVDVGHGKYNSVLTRFGDNIAAGE
jgi:hypothetical protein